MKSINVNTEIIKNAVFRLCVEANTIYDADLYKKLSKKYSENPTHKNALILKNIEIANDTKRPLCQDTGQVLVFVKTGMDVHYTGQEPDIAINEGVEKAYKESYFRKSTVKNALNDRVNTKTNTPAIIYHDIVQGDEIKIDILIKGAGAENYSAVKMFKPADTKNDIFEFIKDVIQNAGEKACPPLVLGVGIGAVMDRAALLSKKAFFENKTTEDTNLSEELMMFLKKENLSHSVLKADILTSATHIASLPVSVTLNCHCSRHSGCLIKNNEVFYQNKKIDFITTNEEAHGIEVNTCDLKKMRTLKTGEDILLTGEIYTARDAAHQRIFEMVENGEQLPFDLKDKIIFYAGPCPNAPNEVIGPIGPTTSFRMDKYLKTMYKNGFFASIGKGERSQEALKIIESNNGKYFTAIGGISCYLSKKIKSSELIAFEDLGTEGIYKLYVEKFPLRVSL